MWSAPAILETIGLAEGFWTDLYHRAMITVYRPPPVFFGRQPRRSSYFLSCAFAFVFWLGDEPIATAWPRRRCRAEPAPLGSRRWRPSSATATCASAEQLRPYRRDDRDLHCMQLPRGDDRADLRAFFAAARPLHLRPHPIVGRHQGQKTLMIRVANARHNTISAAATARLMAAAHGKSRAAKANSCGASMS